MTRPFTIRIGMGLGCLVLIVCGSAMAEKEVELAEIAKQLELAIGTDAIVDIESQKNVPRICITHNHNEVIEQLARLPEPLRARVRGLTFKTDDEKGKAPNPITLKPAPLSNLPALKQLTYLDFSHVQGLVNSSAFFRELPRLTSLDASHTGITPKELADIAECQSLQSLSIGGNNIAAGALTPLGKLTQLRVLALGELEISDNDLKLLSTLRNIETLILFKCPITDKGATVLADYPYLSTVDLNETKVTEEGVKELMRRRPKLMVFWEDSE